MKRNSILTKKINEIIEQKIVITVPYDKKILIVKAIYCNENKSCPFGSLSKRSFLNLKTMNVIYAL